MAAYQPRPAALPIHRAPAGTFAPGTKVQVGSHRVIIEKYLSEGGFAHVYVVKLPSPNNGTAVLKRVAVPDKETLANMRNEVETMKKLRGQKYIVTYLDSHASQLKGTGYEVFLLMEYCSGGGLIDFMNTRLKNRLTEPEIMDIFGDTAEGVACMHYLKPPLLHRDLKVENILISKTLDGQKRYKLCDFGSTAPPRPAPTSAAEGRLIEEDVQRHTTLQYRSPEMIDVYRHKPIDEKSDIWALGVLLYKLCYYTTPFEEQGQMAILKASFKYPSYPPFSDRLKKLIALMLMEDPARRPNIYQVIIEASAMRGKACPIEDIYSKRTRSEARDMQRLPPREPNVKSPPMIGAKIEAPQQAQQHVPDVKPMRRGRPPALSQSGNSPKPSPSPSKRPGGDPFAALDSKIYDERVQAVDELSQKYPAVDDFASLQSKGKFEFGKDTATAPNKPPRPADINQRVTEALADEVFAAGITRTAEIPAASQRPIPAAKPHKQPIQGQPSSSQPIEQPQPQRVGMISTGTMTSRPSSPQRPTPMQSQKPKFEVWRVPQQSDDSLPRASSITRFDNLAAKHPSVRHLSRSPKPDLPTSPASSRPSLEGMRPVIDTSSDLHRSRSTNAAPESQHQRRGSGLFRRGSSKKDSKRRSGVYTNTSAPSSPIVAEDNVISSDVDYLRALEAENEAASKLSHRRSSSTFQNIRHASLPSLGGAKQKFAGRLGETFKRFENNKHTPSQGDDASSSGFTAAPLASRADSDEELNALDSDRQARPMPAPRQDQLEAAEGSTPEQRREIERLQLEAEERRVEDAAAAYRQRLANSQGPSGQTAQPSARASAIQSRVKSLLDESGRVSPVKKTAEGYGRYTQRDDDPSGMKDMTSMGESEITRSSGTNLHMANTIASTNPTQRPNHTASRPPGLQKPLPPKPSVAPKPVTLRTGGRAPLPGQTAVDTQRPPRARVMTPNLMDDSPDRTNLAERNDGAAANLIDDSPSDLEASFAQRYPRLSLDLVEAEIAAPERRFMSEQSAQEVSVGARRVRDV